MKSLANFTLLLLLTARSANAQQEAGITQNKYEQIGQRETVAMAAQLNLSAAQVNSISLINKEYYLKISNLNSQLLSVSDRGQQWQLIWNERTARLNMNLSPLQYNQYFDAIEAKKRRTQQRLDSLRAAHQPH